MAKIPSNESVDHVMNNKGEIKLPRPYLGLSMSGESCYRYLQYYHYLAFNVFLTRRQQRIFNFGHLMEEEMSRDLKTIGITVKETHHTINGVTGHWAGHIDREGVKDDNKYDVFLVEFKTHNDKSFKDVKKKGVKISKPGHYDQMQSYMGYEQYEKCLYMAYNKDTSEYYFEWVEFDISRYKELKRKQIEVVMSEVLLPRIGTNSRSWYECKMCDARHVCFGDKPINKNCRTCQNVDVLNNGKWHCTHHDKNLDVDEQIKGCDQYDISGMFK